MTIKSEISKGTNSADEKPDIDTAKSKQQSKSSEKTKSEKKSGMIRPMLLTIMLA